MRYHFTPSRMAIIKKKKRKTTSVGEDMEKLEPLYIASGNVKVYLHGKRFGGSSKMFNIEFPYAPAISLLSICPKEVKTGTWILVHQCPLQHHSQ